MFKEAACLFIFLSIPCSFSTSVNADDNRPKIVLKTGLPLNIEWNDGRMAVYKTVEMKNDFLSASFIVKENQCNNRVGQNCHLRFQIKAYEVSLEWVKHPDKTKIGRPVYSKKLDSRISDFVYYNFLNKMLDPKRFPEVPPELVCDDYSWIPGGGKAPPPRWKVYEWVTEELRANKETALIENQSNSGAYNLAFERHQNRLTLKSIPQIFASKQKTYILFIALMGDVVHLITKNPEHNLCQITLNISMPTLSKEIEEYKARNRSTPKIEPYGSNLFLYDSPTMLIQMSMKEIVEEISKSEVE